MAATLGDSYVRSSSPCLLARREEGRILPASCQPTAMAERREGGGGAGRGGEELGLQTEAPLCVGLECCSPDGNGQLTLSGLQILVSLSSPGLQAADCVPGLHRPYPCSYQPCSKTSAPPPASSRPQTVPGLPCHPLPPRHTQVSQSAVREAAPVRPQWKLTHSHAP